jgi:hypothetical protein
MNAVTRTRTGHWADRPTDTGPDAGFHPLDEPRDKRVSRAEQQDYQGSVYGPTKRQVVFSAISYLCIVVGVIWLAKVSVTGRLF